MKRLYCFVACGLIASAPSFAGEEDAARPRLVPGGVDIAQGDRRIEALYIHGLSFGALSPVQSSQPSVPTQLFLPSATGTLFDKLALGGYVAYSNSTYSFSSALRSKDGEASADLSASYGAAVLGYPGSTAITLGYDWRRPTSTFSPNTQTSGLDSFDPYSTGLSLSLSWNQSVTPGFYFGGYATAQRVTSQSYDFMMQPSNTFRLGASVGLRF